ncbi:MAG: Hpt domain-containing protein [Treponemataceae bacterium]|nr:Hpt domain-containing protein [Treponemataceae bacterium]
MEKQILNFESGMEMMGDDPEIYREIITVFLQDQQYNQAKIEEMIAQGLEMDAGIEIHRLKGAAATIGAERLQEACAKAERILRGKEEGDATPYIPQITVLYQELIPELEKALQKLQ